MMAGHNLILDTGNDEVLDQIKELKRIFESIEERLDSLTGWADDVDERFEIIKRQFPELDFDM